MTMPQLQLALLAAAAFLAGLAALAAGTAQLIILSLTQRRFQPLRWLTLAVPALLLCCAGLTRSALELGAAGAVLLGWGLGWGLYKIQKRRENHEKTDPRL